MLFCSKCDNMYYIKINSADPNKLNYYCRNCGNEDTTQNIGNVCVLSTNIKKQNHSFNHIINKYTKLDPTLPRINNILCPNGKCATNTTNEPREIIYIRYDDINMKYIYLCSSCENVWKSGEKI